MKHLFTFICFYILSLRVCHAQYKISGKVFDTLNQSPLPNASVVLLRASDSVMEQFSRSKDDGTFEINAGKEGKYVLMITFPSFADYIDVVTAKDDKAISLGVVSMISRTHLLNEFVLTQQIAAIKIKGDTTEYMADSFKVKDNATVEDLLKKLPGLQVDKNGQVTAQGEVVKKILVDGEEFFSDDPAVVTKNFQAAVVDKVQVYDKKSDQAEFTGIDDGVKTKTINLQLKENKKKGFFGKIDAGAGTDGYYQEMGMINDFKGKQQVSVFGIASNTDQVGLGWQDYGKYSSSNPVTEITDGGDVIPQNSSDDADFQGGTYTGQGLPTVYGGGVHYANKWSDDAQHIAANYRYANQDVNLTTNSTIVNILPDNMQNITQQTGASSSKAERHSADGMYEWKIDSMSNLKFTVNGGYKTTNIYSTKNTDIFNENTLTSIDSLINTTNQRTTTATTAQNLNSDLLYQKKFNKKRRTLTIDVKENYKDAQSNGYLYANSVYGNGYDSVTDQRKKNTYNTVALEAKVVYTEPLTKITTLETHYAVVDNNSTSTNYSYNRTPGTDNYNLLDTLYSNDYKYNVLTNTGGANLHFVYKKLNFSVGGDVSDARYKQVDMLGGDTTYTHNYLNLFPKASFVYNVGKTSALYINYLGSTSQPTITQIAPLHQNTDPLNIEVGNPSLKQQFQNGFNAYYRDYKVMSSRFYYVGGTANFINNAFSTSQYTDPTSGVRTYQYINVDGSYNGNVYFGYSKKLQKYNLYIGPDGIASVSHTVSYTNGLRDVSDNNSYTIAFTVDYDKEEKYHFHYHPWFTYNDNHSSIATNNVTYNSFSQIFEGTYNLPLKFEVGTSGEWDLRQRTVLFPTNNNVFKWNAYVSKKFLKDSKLEVRAMVYDILDQNIGFSRTATDNIISQNAYNTIRRHGMLSVIWNFSKSQIQVQPEAGEKKQ